MKTKHFLILFINVLIFFKLSSQVNLSWIKEFEVENNSVELNEVYQQEEDSTFVSIGFNEAIEGGNVYLLRTNQFGITIDSFSYGSITMEDRAFSIESLTNGDYIIGANSSQIDSQFVYILRLDSTFNVVWEKRVPSVINGVSSTSKNVSVIETNDDGFAAIASTDKLNSIRETELFLIKTNSVGDTTWTKTFGFADEDSGSHLIQKDNDEFIIGGSVTLSGGSGAEQGLLFEVDENGDAAFGWDAFIGDNNPDYINHFISLGDSSYIAVGREDLSSTNSQLTITRINEGNNNIIWEKKFGGPRKEEANYIIQDTDSSFIVVGNTTSFSPNVSEIYVLEINMSGDTLWTGVYSCSDNCSPTSVISTLDSGLLISGVIKTTNKNKGFLMKLGGTINPPLIPIDTTVNPPDTTGILTLSDNQLYSFIYPNPVIGSAIIVLEDNSLLKNELLKCSIISVSGRKVKELDFKNDAFELNTEFMNTGLYFYIIQAGEEDISSGEFIISK